MIRHLNSPLCNQLPMTQPVIRIENLGKQYHIARLQRNDDTMIAATARALIGPVRRAGKLLRGQQTGAAELDETFWALRGINFEVEQGEVVGIIGHNGAGKSTLLKLLSRVTYPTEGRISIYGRVGALLEVGTGFNGELTGRENVYLNGAILGMTRAEVDRKFDEIVAFAGVEQFIDTPYKHYSSGMGVRLAFSVAAHLEPEILVIDEVLSVGDAAFQQKSLGKMGDVASAGRTVLFVSHNMSAVSAFCDRVIVLRNGQVTFDGDTQQGIDAYLSTHLDVSETSNMVWQPSEAEIAAHQDDELHVVEVRVVNAEGYVTDAFMSGEPVFIEVDVDWRHWHSLLRVGIDIETNTAGLLFRSNHNDKTMMLDEASFHPGTYTLRARLPENLLNAGQHVVSVQAALHRRGMLWQYSHVVQFQMTLKQPNDFFLIHKRSGALAPVLDWDVVARAETQLVE